MEVIMFVHFYSLTALFSIGYFTIASVFEIFLNV